MKKIGFIGCGNMATAIIKGLLASGQLQSDIFVYDIDEKKMQSFAADGINVCGDEIEVAKNSEFVVLAVKPQVIAPLLEKLGDCAKETVYVSIAAGISTASIKRLLGYDAKVIRVMPNTSLLMGLGATAVSYTPPVSRDEFVIVKEMFASSGIVEEIDEALMNAIICVNGSSPAYVYYLAKAVVDGGEKQGIDREMALRLFIKVLEGSAKMLELSGDSPDELISKVCSKGGTTIEAINTFDEKGVHDAVILGMDACTKRAGELDIPGK